MVISHAEVYGFGKSEKYLGDFQQKTNTSVKIATKFAPVPWRFTSDAPVKALKVSYLTLASSSSSSSSSSLRSLNLPYPVFFLALNCLLFCACQLFSTCQLSSSTPPETLHLSL